MQPFKNILFVPDVSDRSGDFYDLVVSQAEANEAALAIFGVVPPAPPLQEFVRLGSPPRTVDELLEAEITETFKSHARNYEGRINIDVGVVHGSPAAEIAQRATDLNHDLVIMTSDGSEERETLVRSVLRTCPCPVEVLRPRIETRNVLAAINPNGQRDLDLSILRQARLLATEGGGDLHVVHSWEVYGEAALIKSEHVKVEMRELAEYATVVEGTHKQKLDELVAEAGEDLGASIHLINGSPTEAISALVRLYRIDLLIMGSVGRSNYEGVIVGNTAESVFREVNCSVLVIKPSDFVCPVLS